MTDTNWPNPERPGVPMFPERDGKHVIDVDPEGPKNELVYYWKAKHQVWVEYDHEGHDAALEGYDLIGWAYIGPILTPAQISEMLAAERERAVAACLSQKEVFESPEYAGGPLGAVMERFACDQCIQEIRNLGDAP